MKTLTQVTFATVTLVGWVGVATAQPTAGKAAPPAAPVMVAPPPPKPRPMPQTPPPMASPDDMLVKAGAAMAGTWKCKGTLMQRDGSSIPMVGTDKVAVELDKWFIHTTFTAPLGKLTFRFESYDTYDAATKTWNRVTMMNDGDWLVGSAKATDPTKQDFDLTTNGPAGVGMFRDHADASDAKSGVKMWGEMSVDKGKTWLKVYEQTCKK